MLPAVLICAMLGLIPPGDPSTDDSLDVVDARTITVVADPPASAVFTGVPSTFSTTVDEMMTNGSAMLIRRAAMAGEAVVGGLRGGQVTMSIDGMKIHSACVDKMDPATAYIELENLQSLELTQGSADLRYGSNLGGALTFRMRQPKAGDPTAAMVDAWYEGNGNARTVKASVSGSSGGAGARGAYTYRAADDYSAGGGSVVVGSRFEKHNALVSGTWLVDEVHTVGLSAIYDLATFIGYPALLMDTRRAEAVIGGVTWASKWTPNVRSTVRLYANTVHHVMDDYDRPENEVAQRVFMPGMYMPMYGTTVTSGLISEVRWTSATSVLTAVLDLSMLDATATMDMVPLDTTVRQMSMTNIGDARVGSFGLNTTYDVSVATDLSLRSDLRLEVSPRTLRDPAAREILLAYVPEAEIDRTITAFSASIGLLSSISSRLNGIVTLSTLQRMPTHLESYGFWLYDPQANIVTIGDPSLRSERSWGAELTLESVPSTSAAQYRFNARSQFITDYIAPGDVLESGTVPLRQMSNIGNALLYSVNGSAQLRVAPTISIGGTAAWTLGHSVHLNEPLPFISPLTGMLRAVWSPDSINFEVRLRGAIAQESVSSTIVYENTTPAWWTLDVMTVWQVLPSIALSASIRNVMDTLYHDHTSINDLAASGRSIMIRVRTSW